MSESRPLRFGYLAGAAALLAVALLPPLSTLAHGILFSAHMLQHLLLLLGVPAFALLGFPPTSARRSISPVLGWAAGAAGMWVWHVPLFCNAAVRSAGIQSLQTVSLLGFGALFWWPLIGAGSERRLAPLAGVTYLFAGCVSCTLQGILLTFSPVEICSAFLNPADPGPVLPWLSSHWGFTPAADQQIGGLIMWVPACLVYLGAIMAQFVRWYGSAGARALS
ncbi:MAG TPA: cytochrome c oxidase assembly protein [Opitutaceae bacterium]|jgi:cytochrome c oxidase assembly factor CtaG